MHGVVRVDALVNLKQEGVKGNRRFLRSLWSVGMTIPARETSCATYLRGRSAWIR